MENNQSNNNGEKLSPSSITTYTETERERSTALDIKCCRASCPSVDSFRYRYCLIMCKDKINKSQDPRTTVLTD